MKRLLPLLFTVIMVNAYAQTTPTKAFSAGLELGIPTTSVYTVGFGGSGKAEVPLFNALSLSVTAGYTSFYYKSAPIGSAGSPDPAGFVPLKAGAKFFFGPGVYAEGELGTVLQTNYGKDSMFAYSIGPGLIFPTGNHTGIEVSFRYENWGGGLLRQTAIRAAYRLGW